MVTYCRPLLEKVGSEDLPKYLTLRCQNRDKSDKHDLSEKVGQNYPSIPILYVCH